MKINRILNLILTQHDIDSRDSSPNIAGDMDDIDDERSSSIPPTSPRGDYEGDRATSNHQTQSVSTPESRDTPSPQR